MITINGLVEIIMDIAGKRLPIATFRARSECAAAVRIIASSREAWLEAAPRSAARSRTDLFLGCGSSGIVGLPAGVPDRSICMSAALATPKPVRLLQLDVLRGIAVLLVMGYHLPALPILSNAGYLSVDLFFVLSGFLVSGLLFREIQSTGGVNLSRFYLRRALKIYPSVYLLLALTYLLFTAALGWAQVSNTALGDLLLSQNYLGGLWGHTWSLAVEEHFYLLLPVTLILLLGLRTRTARDLSTVALRVWADHARQRRTTRAERALLPCL